MQSRSPDYLGRLKQATAELDATLLEDRLDRARSILPVSMDPQVIVCRETISELRELHTIFDMIVDELATLRNIDERDQARTWSVGTLEPGTEEYRDANLRFKTPRQAEVHIKAAYEWFAHLEQYVCAEPSLNRALSQSVRRRLKAVIEFRNKLVAHRRAGRVYRKVGQRYNPRSGSFEVLQMPFVPPAGAEHEVGALWQRCLPELPAEVGEEDNVVERCGILSRNLDRFTETLRIQVVAIMNKYGGISAEPADLAELARDIARPLPHYDPPRALDPIVTLNRWNGRVSPYNRDRRPSTVKLGQARSPHLAEK